MSSPHNLFSLVLAPALALASTPALAGWEPPAVITDWKFNDNARPLPESADPVPEAELLRRSQPPPNAQILFDGTGLDAWNPSRWKLLEGVLEIIPGSGWLVSKEAYGSCRLHLEWSTASEPPLKSGQNRGNSGIFFMGLYEVQILDTYQNKTYADGMAGGVYGQYPPRVNPIRPPGQWQFYDIVFRRPVFDASGALVKPARITVDFNGVRVQDEVELSGPTNPPGRRPYRPHADALPLQLQDHKEVVRFRNIWIERLEDGTP